jgi:hypothetical protein
MKNKLVIYSLGIALTAINAVQAQSVSPSSAGGTELPPPEPPFKGVIAETYKDSKPDKIPIIKAPEGAPNVLLVLIDDCPSRSGAPLAVRFRHQTWIGLPSEVSATLAFTPPLCARRHVPLS